MKLKENTQLPIQQLITKNQVGITCTSEIIWLCINCIHVKKPNQSWQIIIFLEFHKIFPTINHTLIIITYS